MWWLDRNAKNGGLAKDGRVECVPRSWYHDHNAGSGWITRNEESPPEFLHGQYNKKKAHRLSPKHTLPQSSQVVGVHSFRKIGHRRRMQTSRAHGTTSTPSAFLSDDSKISHFSWHFLIFILGSRLPLPFSDSKWKPDSADEVRRFPVVCRALSFTNCYDRLQITQTHKYSEISQVESCWLAHCCIFQRPR